MSMAICKLMAGLLSPHVNPLPMEKEREIINKQTDMLDIHDRYLKISETIQHQRHQGLFSKWSWFFFQCSHRYGKVERKPIVFWLVVSRCYFQP